MYRFLLFACFLCFACAEKTENRTKVAVKTVPIQKEITVVFDSTTIDSAKLGINFTPKGNYQTIKQTMQTDRAYFLRKYQQNKEKAIDSASRYLYDKILNAIVPHWYGTPWDFNGYTNIPNTGEIACGYFVSTTLKHAGFRLNRYKMAQEAGLNEAISLQPKSELKIYQNIAAEVLKEKLNKVYQNGLYFVGLSNHVGYLLIHEKEIYFLHSSYCDNKVVIEKAVFSPCFQSDIYVIAEISSNKKLIEKWITNTVIPIHK